jgi:SAM-dependent methyltransferase
MVSHSTEGQHYYRADLARVHHEGFGFHADGCASDIVELLSPLRDNGGLVLELGCGSGLLTRHLVDAGFRVVATDASPAMLDLAKGYAHGAEDFRQLVLPRDRLPPADAIVSIGHALSYLADEESIDSALVQIAGALRRGGILALDLCDLEWGRARQNERYKLWRTEQWVLMTEFSMPSPSRYVREMTMFIHNDDGSWRRDDERHDNVLIDTSRVPSLMERHGLEASVSSSFGRHELPVGLVAIVGRRS